MGVTVDRNGIAVASIDGAREAVNADAVKKL
jgi:hypothetical protein